MNLIQSLSRQAIAAFYLVLFQSGPPGQGLLNSISQFITGPFGKAITLIAIVLCGCGYMYGKQSDNSNIGRLTTRPRFTTLILLPPQERILDFVIGDRDAWVLEGTQNFAYLKPTKAGLETSVNLVTASGNIYTFDCTSADPS